MFSQWWHQKEGVGVLPTASCCSWSARVESNEWIVEWWTWTSHQIWLEFQFQSHSWKIIPCPACVQSMKITLLGSQSDTRACSHCDNFWMNPETMQNNEMEDFPIPGPQKCKKLTFPKLKDAVNSAHESVLNGAWSEKLVKIICPGIV